MLSEPVFAEASDPCLSWRASGLRAPLAAPAQGEVVKSTSSMLKAHCRRCTAFSGTGRFRCSAPF